jgi:hypothetical protein
LDIDEKMRLRLISIISILIYTCAYIIYIYISTRPFYTSIYICINIYTYKYISISIHMSDTYIDIRKEIQRGKTLA